MREGGREGGREGERERGREGGKEGGREGRREGREQMQCKLTCTCTYVHTRSSPHSTYSTGYRDLGMRLVASVGLRPVMSLTPKFLLHTCRLGGGSYNQRTLWSTTTHTYCSGEEGASVSEFSLPRSRFFNFFRFLWRSKSSLNGLLRLGTFRRRLREWNCVHACRCVCVHVCRCVCAGVCVCTCIGYTTRWRCISDLFTEGRRPEENKSLIHRPRVV